MPDTDHKRMLEMAAKAAGLKHKGYSDFACGDADHPRDGEPGLVVAFDDRNELCDSSGAWNPLSNDGDALRLAVKLRIDIITWASTGETWAPAPMQRSVIVPWEGDEYAATRRAVVLAAAAIGEQMP